MTTEQITQQANTIEQYNAHMRRLITEFTASTGRDWRLHPLRLVEWVGGLRSRWASATWRVYRAALTNVIRGEFPALVEEAKQILNNASATLPPKPKKSYRVKKLSTEHLAQIVDLATSSRSANLSLAVLMLRCTEALGLRPHEWFGTKREGNDIIVRNSKHTNGRAFGPERHIKLDTVSAEESELIDYMIAYANKHGSDESWRGRVKIVSVTLRRAVVSLSIPGLQLYSARHQFSANAKLAGLSYTEIAALMGHASNETAATHYGRRSAGRVGGLRVKPGVDDVEAVASLNAERDPRGYRPPGQTTLPLSESAVDVTG
jgi:integrase